MTRLALGLLALTGCHGSDPTGNAPTLWLGPDQNETHVKLVDSEPQPY